MTRPHKNWLEWLVFAMSLVVIAGFIGVLVYAAFMTKDAPASLRVFLGEPRKEQSHFIVPVLVQNRGGAAAAAVRIEGVLDSGSTVERRGFELAYAPGGSSRHGEVSFSSDPREGRLNGRAIGFELP